MISDNGNTAAALADVRQAVAHAAAPAAGVGRAAGGLGVRAAVGPVAAASAAALGLCGAVAASTAAARIQGAGGFAELPRGRSLPFAGGTPMVNADVGGVLRVAVATVRAAVVHLIIAISAAAAAAAQLRAAVRRHAKGAGASAGRKGALSARADHDAVGRVHSRLNALLGLGVAAAARLAVAVVPVPVAAAACAAPTHAEYI